ncbi:MAG: hypothetical protein ACK6D7_29370 [Acidobacteriota bacterium]
MNAMTVQTLIAEAGLDMSRWPTEYHFVWWVGVAPRGFQGRKSLVISDICAWIDRLMACFTQRWVDFGLREALGPDKHFAIH